MPKESKHTEASFSLIFTVSLCLQVAQIPRSRDMAIFMVTTDRWQTTDKTDCFTPCACARGNNVINSIPLEFLLPNLTLMHQKKCCKSENFCCKSVSSRWQLQKLIWWKHITLMWYGVIPMKTFNTKICHTKVSYHENFQIYGKTIFCYPLAYGYDLMRDYLPWLLLQWVQHWCCQYQWSERNEESAWKQISETDSSQCLYYHTTACHEILKVDVI